VVLSKVIQFLFRPDGTDVTVIEYLMSDAVHRAAFSLKALIRTDELLFPIVYTCESGAVPVMVTDVV
jgi:hypothetical protein